MQQVASELKAGVPVLHLKGQFVGGEETDELRAALSGATEQQIQKLVVNLEDVSYLNSTALGVLISAHSNFAKRDAKIALCSVGKSIENIFVITKLTLVFSIYDNVDEAIENLK